MSNGTIIRNNIIYSGDSDKVSYVPTSSEGAEIGTLTINGEDNKLYAPNSIVNNELFYSYESYSEEEKIIGCWTNGKPVYRKNILLDTPQVEIYGVPVTTKKDVTQLNIDEMVNIYGFYNGYTGEGTIVQHLTINAFINMGDNNVPFFITSFYSHNSIFLRCDNPTWNNFSAVISVEYTKTTDTNNSFVPSMIIKDSVLPITAINYEDYSTKEKVVGCWIDGKPVYRKVVSGTTSSTPYATSGSRYHVKIDGFENITLINGFGKVGTYTIPSTAPNSSNTVTYSSVFTTEGGVNLFSDKEDRYTNLQYKYYIDYTKTTDEPNSFTPNMINPSCLIEQASDEDVNDILADI